MNASQKQFARIPKWSGLVLGAVTALAVTASAEPSARITAAQQSANDSSRPEKERLTAIRRLGESNYENAGSTLLQLLSTNQPDAIRIGAVRALEELNNPQAVSIMLAGWTNYAPAVKHQVLLSLTSKPALANVFVDRLEHNVVPLADIDAATRQRLANFPDENIVARSQKIFARQPWLDAKATLERFRPALALRGDAARGKEIFKERACVNCHRVGDEGHFVGADLFSAKEMSREELLQQIVAPNLFFMPTFQAFVAETNDGELIEGVVAASTETTVTIRQALGMDRVLNRSSLKRLKGLNVSLMPEGLLEGAKPQEVADLLEFIKSLRGF